jgi:peptidoglycan/xylan/chitin deacetylase (PgdA/CDA1 family)
MGIFNCIPAMMYHHVNNGPEDSISITPENFETQIKYLADNGYKSLFLSEFYSLMKHWSIPKNVVLITFDDGYADNYEHAYPILKKYNIKATIFPVTSFIKDKVGKRENGHTSNFDLLMKTATAKGGMDGFLTWEEMREMEKSGLIDIQAHCHTHAAYFEADKILSFYKGGINTKLAWATGGDLRFGVPIYRMGPALAIRKYFDDKGLRDKIANFVANNGGSDFFYRQDAERILFDIVEEHGDIQGRFETEEESEKRIMDELKLTKELIEKNLNKKVDHICWPWGSVDKPLIERAKKAGFIGGVGMKGGANMRLTNVMDTHRFNPCKKDIPALKMKLFKHSHLFYSLYNDKKIDNIILNRKRFEQPS